MGKRKRGDDEDKRERGKKRKRDKHREESKEEKRERRHKKEKKRKKKERHYSSSEESDSGTEAFRHETSADEKQTGRDQHGPALPPHLVVSSEGKEGNSSDAGLPQGTGKVHHGPALPPHLLATLEKKDEKLTETEKSEQKRSGPIGPSLEDKPEELRTENLAQVGPICPGQMTGEVETFATQRLLESRTKRMEESEAQRLKDKSREEWMLSLPSLDRKNPLGDLLKTSSGPKTFSNRQGPVEQDKSWSATPGEATVTTHIDQAKAFKQSVQGVFDQKTTSKEKERESLLDQHRKKETKKKKEKPKKPEFRFSGHWDRERDVTNQSLSDTQLNKMVDASKGWEGRFTK